MPALSQVLSAWEQQELAGRIRRELRRLGILGHLRGYYYLTYMLIQVVPDPAQLELVTKHLYPETGESFGVSAASVERAARTSVAICWKGTGRNLLDQMADRRLDRRPTISEFLDIVADHIRRSA